jgi:uncharacterized protein with ParB-like and HNH nuclease domain
MPIRVEQSSQTISWFKDRLNESNLVFKPPFQRNPVWLPKHKAYLIDTVLRGLPIPEVYIQKETDAEGHTTYGVVDGQQRLRALLEFSQNDVALMGAYSPTRDGQTWDDLTADERKRFWHYRLVLREIENASDADLRDLFRRLNQHTVTLNAQELRNARFKGDFILTVTDLADQDFWAESRVVSAKDIRRMLDIEYVAELLIGIMHGPQNKKASLDAFFEAYDDKIPNKIVWLKEFEETRSSIEQLVPELKASRWKGRSDFYSLFLAVHEVAKGRILPKTKLPKAQQALKNFGEQVTGMLSKDAARHRYPTPIRRYAVAVEKAASDKDRRETRHQILKQLLLQYFSPSTAV